MQDAERERAKAVIRNRIWDLRSCQKNDACQYLARGALLAYDDAFGSGICPNQGTCRGDCDWCKETAIEYEHLMYGPLYTLVDGTLVYWSVD